MQKNDKQLGTPFTDYSDTKSNIELLQGLTGGETAYAIDTGQDGYYNHITGAWIWLHNAGGGGGSSINVQDEGVPLGVVTTFDFVGAPVEVSVSGTVARVFITGSSGGSSVHNDLSGLQGGQSGQYYHLTSNQINGLVSGSYTNLHYHSGTTSREVLTTDRTYYIRTDGNDSNDGLTDSSGGAFLTATKANQVVATIDKNGYNITVKSGAGTWNETLIISEGVGDGSVTWEGTLTLIETATSATVVAGSGATHGTVTKTGQFTGDNHTGKLAYFVTDGAYRVIDSNTNDVLTLCGTAPSSTTQDVIVYEVATIINSFTFFGNTCILRFLKLDTASSTNSLFLNPNSGIEAYMCVLNTRVRGELASFRIVDYCVIYTTIAQAALQLTLNGAGLFRQCFIRAQNTGSIGFQVFNGASVILNGCVIDGTNGSGGKASYGIFANAGGIVTFTNTLGNNKVRNCDVGLASATGAQIVGTSGNTYSSNNTNESATAASYGYID